MSRRDLLRGIGGLGLIALGPAHPANAGPLRAPTWLNRARRSVDDGAALDELALEAAQRLRIPGAAVGIVHAGSELATVYGVTKRANAESVDRSTLFGLASITKTFTALAGMRLVDQGRLDLDVPIRSYLPDLRLAKESAARRITLRHLFSHTSGLPRDHDDWGDFGADDGALARMIARYDQLELLAAPGESYEYSNVGIDLAARVIEVVGGRSYESLVRDLILTPLGMTRSTFFAAEASGNVAWGHENQGRRAVPPFATQRAEHSDGGLASSLDDQLRYARFWLNDGVAPGETRLLNAARLAEMFTPRVEVPEGGSIGVVWEIEDREGIQLISHDGLWAGFATLLMLAPDQQFGLSVLTSSEDGEDFCGEVADWALEYFLELEPDDE